MRCEKAKRRLPLYSGGDLSARKTRKLQAHLEHCSSCRKETEEYRTALDRVRNAAKQAITPDWDEAAWSGTMARIAVEKPLGERRFGALAPRWAFAAAGLGVVLITALALYFFKDTLFRQKDVLQASLPVAAEKDPRSPESQHPDVELDLEAMKEDSEKTATGLSDSETEADFMHKPRDSADTKTDPRRAVPEGRPAQMSVEQTSIRPHIAAAHPELKPEAAQKARDAETPISQKTAAGVPQDVLSVTFVSQETGLQIAWFFHRDFDWKGDKK
ncbi:MAG: zf-HC2 domain-containing protein [Acidobacteriota bacterium]|nr:zf-HC2 domain-containing protein [Acidobacteriota bacterium]